MPPKLTPKRLAFLRQAAARPHGDISSLLITDAGEKVWLRAADEIALEELGYAASICDHGHINTSTSGLPYGHPHRGCAHTFRLTDAGRTAVTDASPGSDQNSRRS